MSEEEAVSAIDELLVGDQSIPGKLAMKKGIDEEAVARLESAIETLMPIYKVRNDIPKKVAAAFLDLAADFDRTMPLYSSELQDRIEDLKLHIISLGYDLFGS
ncbi:MAG TPA: hypothetical protein VH601_19450 [Bryobacteraceae bacterium]|jgi:hypothetical protein